MSKSTLINSAIIAWALMGPINSNAQGEETVVEVFRKTQNWAVSVFYKGTERDNREEICTTWEYPSLLEKPFKLRNDACAIRVGKILGRDMFIVWVDDVINILESVEQSWEKRGKLVPPSSSSPEKRITPPLQKPTQPYKWPSGYSVTPVPWRVCVPIYWPWRMSGNILIPWSITGYNCN